MGGGTSSLFNLAGTFSLSSLTSTSNLFNSVGTFSLFSLVGISSLSSSILQVFSNQK